MDDKGARFLELHHRDRPLLMPNPWDIGSARVLESIGFEALATTSSGFAATLGRHDGAVTRDEAIAHGAALAAAVEVPVSADLENCFADDPAGAADTIDRAVASGLAGGSIEDYTRDDGGRVYDFDHSVERVAAAAEAAHRASNGFVLTARAENLIRGRIDLDDTIARLVAYANAGADCLFAPGLSSLDDITTVVQAVDKPLNVLALPNAPTVRELSEAGVRRISVGGSFAYVALGALVEAGRELLDAGTYGYWERSARGRNIVGEAFRRRDA